MSNTAEVNILWYENLKSRELNKLKSIDGEVHKILVNNGITTRCIWTSHTTKEGRRIKLLLPRKQQDEIILNVSEEEFSNLSPADILSKLRNSLK